MSAKHLQRVVVRMLHDPALVEAVYADPERALADVPLTAAERRWLVAPDRRRWAADPMRRTRALRALLEEYPTAGALAARHHGLDALDGFFSAPAFHRCVQDRGSLADAFGAWLEGFDPAELRALAALERGIARVRRARRPEAPAPVADRTRRWRTAPWAWGAALPGGALAAWHRRRAQLGAHPDGPLAALLDPAFDLGAPAPLAAHAPEGVVVERTDDVAVGDAPAPLGALLATLSTPRPWPEVAAALEALGAEPHELEEVAADLLADGLLSVE